MTSILLRSSVLIESWEGIADRYSCEDAGRIRNLALTFPNHIDVQPEDFLHFVELDEFSDDWNALGLDVDNDLWALQIAIMAKPNAGDVIPGTGGLRKLRFAKDSSDIGKRGGLRVCYVYFPEHWTVLLVMAYDKKARDVLSTPDRRAIRKYIEQIRSWLSERNY